jgi:hypothetical protein
MGNPLALNSALAGLSGAAAGGGVPRPNLKNTWQAQRAHQVAMAQQAQVQQVRPVSRCSLSNQHLRRRKVCDMVADPRQCR